MLVMVNTATAELNAQLDASEQVKLSQFATLEKRDRQVVTLQTLLRKMQGVIEAHKDAFAPLPTINYEAIAADLQPHLTPL